MSLFELRNVGRHYKSGEVEVHALDGISLVIDAGEFVAIVGQSGSGKSTLMNVLGCLDSPSRGELLVDGQDACRLTSDDLAALRRERFGFIFQRYHLLPHADAASNVGLPALYTTGGAAQRTRRAVSLLEQLGLGGRLGHKPVELSGGEQQRVAIARALMNGGHVILADEPTGALDSASGDNVLLLLKDLNDRGHTIILVTHDARVAAHASRIIELKDGKLISDTGIGSGKRPATELRLEQRPVQTVGWFHRLTVQWHEVLSSAVLALRVNRLRSFLSMLGISIGIASVVSVVALTSAARLTIEANLSSLISGRIPVLSGNPNSPPGTVAQPFRPQEIDSLRALAGVRAISANHQMQLVARHGGRDAVIAAVGGDSGTFKVRKFNLIEGRYFTAIDDEMHEQVALLDGKARDTLFKPDSSPVGEIVFLNATAAEGSSNHATVAAIPFRVVGVVGYEGGAFAFSSSMGQLYLPRTTFSRKLDTRIDVEGFDVLLDPGVPPSQVQKQIVHRLKAWHGAEDFTTWTSEAEFRKLQNVTGSMAALLAGVSAISLLVGGVGIMNMMLVSVSERTQEIGIRIAVGARGSDIYLQFLVEAVVLCCLGGFFGLIVSFLIAEGLNAVQHELKVAIPWVAIGWAFSVSTCVGILFGTIPARRAAALSPADALARE